jgi:chemotaxis protein histidine kinase CheA
VPRRAAATLAAVLLIAGFAASGAPARAATSAPSWSDVQNARGDQAATQALVTRLGAALQEAESRAAAASEAALATAAEADRTRTEAERAAHESERLRAASAAAEARRAETSRTLAILVSDRYREEAKAPLVPRLLTEDHPTDLLGRLTVLDRLSHTWRGLAETAVREAQAAAALRDDAAEAEATSASVAAAAQRAADAAQAAVDAETTTVSGLKGDVDTMYAQLASLKQTTADVERRYRVGQQVAQQPAATGAGAGASSGGSSSSGESSSGGGASTGTGGSTGSGSGVSVDPAGAKAYARGALPGYGWGDDQFGCLEKLWNRESGWRADALNRSSGAYGIPQSLPAEKMAAAGPDWRTNGNTQVDWGLSYIKGRYGSPCSAWDHSEKTGWY